MITITNSSGLSVTLTEEQADILTDILHTDMLQVQRDLDNLISNNLEAGPEGMRAFLEINKDLDATVLAIILKEGEQP